MGAAIIRDKLLQLKNKRLVFYLMYLYLTIRYLNYCLCYYDNMIMKCRGIPRIFFREGLANRNL